MPRFIHAADLQIGREYGTTFPTPAAAYAIAEARLGTVKTIANLAVAHDCQAVLVAGDVFDSQTVDNRTMRILIDAMAGFSGPWILIPGNHDPALPESVWSRLLRSGISIPSNVHIVLKPGTLSFPELGFVVLAAALTQKNTLVDLTEWFDEAETEEGLVRVGLAHGAVQGILMEEAGSQNPISPTRAQSAQLDYLALGDWHGMKQVNDRIWYSGTHEQDRFKSNNPGHVLLVDIPEVGALPKVTPIRTTRYTWVEMSETLSISTDVDRLANTLKTLGTDTALNLTLDGSISLATAARLTDLLQQTDARLRSLSCDRAGLKEAPSEEDIAAIKADGYLAEVVDDLRKLQPDKPEAAAGALSILAAILKDIHGEGGI